MTADTASPPKKTTLCAAAIALIALVYLVQLLSPLRLNTDAVTLLSMACNKLDGLGFTEQGEPTQFPIGYPLYLMALIKTHLACSAAFIATNLVCLSIALWQFSKIASRYWQAPSDHAGPRIGWVIAFFLLAFPTVKHVTMPLSEMPFMALSMSSLLCMTEWNRGTKRSWSILLLGAVLALCSIMVRTIGITLLPALLWAVITDPVIKRWLLPRARKPLVAVPSLLAMLLMAGAGFWLISNTKYYRNFAMQAHDPATVIKTAVTGRFTDATELFCNVPIERIGHLPLSMVIGIIPIALLVTGLVVRKRAGAVEIFLLGYMALMVIWPYRDARFWVPVLPFLMLLIAGVFDRIRLPKVIGCVVKYGYLTAFAVMGIVALGYSTRLSISGDSFADKYGTPETRATYEKAFGRPVDPKLKPYLNWIPLIERFERRAQQTTPQNPA